MTLCFAKRFKTRSSQPCLNDCDAKCNARSVPTLFWIIYSYYWQRLFLQYWPNFGKHPTKLAQPANLNTTLEQLWDKVACYPGCAKKIIGCCIKKWVKNELDKDTTAIS